MYAIPRNVKEAWYVSGWGDSSTSRRSNLQEESVNNFLVPNSRQVRYVYSGRGTVWLYSKRFDCREREKHRRYYYN